MFAEALQCVNCSEEYELLPLYECTRCGGILDVTYQFGPIPKSADSVSRQEKKYEFLPIRPEQSVYLGEGNTALVEAKRLAGRIGVKSLLLKCEFSNPTGSFKDRAVSIGMSKALEYGYSKVIVASSGNGAASVAAYAARAGLESIILVPESTPQEKVKQTIAYGGRVIRIKGSYSNCFNLAKVVGERFGMYNLTTTFINPYTVEGDKTVAHELYDQMNGSVPDVIYVPIGAGPLLVGTYKGYVEYQRLGYNTKLPRMAGIQAEGCSPIAKAFRSGQTEVYPDENPSTIASGICDGLHGYAKDGTYTLQMIKESKGFALGIPDKEIIQAQQWLAQDEGIFAEPTGASGIAGLIKSLEMNLLDREAQVVVLVTGHGLKDMNQVKGDFDAPTIPNEADQLIQLIS